MAKYQDFLSRVGSNRDRAALRGIFSMFLTDDNPPALKDLVLASIILSGAETTQVTISGACTTGILQSGTSTTAYSITGAFTTGISIAADGTTGIAITSAFSGVNMISLAGTGSTSGILISGACGAGVSVTGSATSAFSTGTGTFTNGVLLGGTLTTGVSIGAATTGISLTGAVTTGISITGTATTAISVAAASTVAFTTACATDSTSVSTGSINTAGGLGVAKAAWIGGLVNIAGVLTAANATDATSTTAAGTVVTGGLGVAKKTFLGDTVVVTAAKAVIQGMNTFPLVTLTSKTSAATVALTAAEVIGGYISDAVSEANAATLPAPADIVAAIPNAKVGTSFFLVYKNAAGGASAITVTANGASSIDGTATIGQNNTKLFLARITNIGSGTEAVVFYSVGTFVH